MRDNKLHRLSLSEIQFELDTTYNVYTGISCGLYAFNVTISQDGLLMDPDVVSDGDVSLMDLHDYGFLTLHKSGASVGDGGVVCKQDRCRCRCHRQGSHALANGL